MAESPARSEPGSTPRISVVIPFYRGEARLGRALRSVARQTLQPLEIVLVDDGSPVALQVDAYCADAAIPLNVVRHPLNRGIPAARNSGIRSSKGDWIAFLDQDDEWAPDKLERQWRFLRAARSPQRTVAFGRCLVVSEAAPGEGRLFPSRKAISRVEAGGGSSAAALMLLGNIVPFVTLLVHRSVFDHLGALDETLAGGADDYELVLRLAAEGLSFQCADRPGVPARYSAVHYLTGNNYSDPERFFADEIMLLDAMGRRYPALQRLHRKGLARTHYRLARSYDTVGASRRALSHHRTARGLDPYWIAPWGALVMHHAPPSVAKLLAAVRGWLSRG